MSGEGAEGSIREWMRGRWKGCSCCLCCTRSVSFSFFPFQVLICALPEADRLILPSLRYTRGLGWRMHCGVEVTESSTNKQHHHHLVQQEEEGDAEADREAARERQRQTGRQRQREGEGKDKEAETERGRDRERACARAAFGALGICARRDTVRAQGDCLRPLPRSALMVMMFFIIKLILQKQ
jgi:hypothetical protein